MPGWMGRHCRATRLLALRHCGRQACCGALTRAASAPSGGFAAGAKPPPAAIPPSQPPSASWPVGARLAPKIAAPWRRAARGGRTHGAAMCSRLASRRGTRSPDVGETETAMGWVAAARDRALMGSRARGPPDSDRHSRVPPPRAPRALPARRAAPTKDYGSRIKIGETH